MTECGPAASVKGSAKKPPAGPGRVRRFRAAAKPGRRSEHEPVSNNAPLPGGTDDRRFGARGTRQTSGFAEFAGKGRAK